MRTFVVALASILLLASCSIEQAVPDPMELMVVAPADSVPISVDGVLFGFGKARVMVFRNYPNLLQIGDDPVVIGPGITYSGIQFGRVK